MFPQHGPWGSRGPLGRSPKNITIEGILGINSTQFFSTENESRVHTYLRFQIRLPQGGPQGGGGVSISNEPNDISYYSGLDMMQNCPALDTLWIDSADDAHGTSPPVFPCLATAEGGNLQSNNICCQNWNIRYVSTLDSFAVLKNWVELIPNMPSTVMFYCYAIFH